jgi:hypothetical protein
MQQIDTQETKHKKVAKRKKKVNIDWNMELGII